MNKQLLIDIKTLDSAAYEMGKYMGVREFIHMIIDDNDKIIKSKKDRETLKRLYEKTYLNLLNEKIEKHVKVWENLLNDEMIDRNKLHDICHNDNDLKYI